MVEKFTFATPDRNPVYHKPSCASFLSEEGKLHDLSGEGLKLAELDLVATVGPHGLRPQNYCSTTR